MWMWIGIAGLWLGTWLFIRWSNKRAKELEAEHKKIQEESKMLLKKIFERP